MGPRRTNPRTENKREVDAWRRTSDEAINYSDVIKGTDDQVNVVPGAGGSVTLEFDSPTKLGEDIDGDDYSEFEEDGTLEFHGDAKVWDDLRVSVNDTQANGSNPPSDALFKNDGNEVPGDAYALSFLSNTLGNLTLPDNVNFDTSADFTFNFWVRPTLSTGQWECMRKNDVFEIDFRNTDVFRWNVQGTGNTTGVIQFNRGSWNMVTVVHDDAADEVTFYVNNQEDTVISIASVPDNTNDFVFNRQETPYDVDYIEYWDKALSVSEISDRWASGAGDQLLGSETGLKGLWELNDGSGTTVVEKTGLASDGSITGGSEGVQWDWIGGHVGNSSAGSRGVILKYFSPDETMEVYFTIQMSHAWKSGTIIKPHVHFATLVDGGTDETVRWGVEYTWVDINGVFGDTTTIYSSQQIDNLGQPIDITAYKHHYAPMSDIDGSGISGVSSQLVCRLFRDAEDAADDFDDFAGLIEFDIHYEINTVGSRQENMK